LGVNSGVLSRWVQEFSQDEAEAFPSQGRRKSKDQELFELKRELAQVREERDILKKALSVFSRLRD